MVPARYQQIPEASLKDREDDQLDEVRADDQGIRPENWMNMAWFGDGKSIIFPWKSGDMAWFLSWMKHCNLGDIMIRILLGLLC